jgi:aspartate racemase
MKTIGIIGGMGPQGTGDLYMGIVGLFQRQHGARYDADFPPILLHSVPAPEVVERLEDEVALSRMLVGSARTLESAGADFIAIACNTAHIVQPDVAAAVTVPVLHLPTEVAMAVAADGHTRVSVLATGLTMDRGLYLAPCRQRGIAIVEPDVEQQRAVTRIIMAVLAGGDLSDARRSMAALLDELARAGAEAVILGCTDLGPAVEGLHPPLPVYDSTMILAQACVRGALPSGLQSGL